jgi:hypothetical protein
VNIYGLGPPRHSWARGSPVPGGQDRVRQIAGLVELDVGGNRHHHPPLRVDRSPNEPFQLLPSVRTVAPLESITHPPSARPVGSPVPVSGAGAKTESPDRSERPKRTRSAGVPR